KRKGSTKRFIAIQAVKPQQDSASVVFFQWIKTLRPATALSRAGRKHYVKRLLVGNNRNGAAVLAPGRLIRTHDSPAFFAVADGRDAAGGDAQTHQVFLGGCGTAFTER